MRSKAIETAIVIFRKKDGVLRYTEALDSGIAPITLYSMVDNGLLQKMSRGVYALPEKAFAGNTDLIIISKKIKNAVVCLISALFFHKITTFIPHEVYIALPRGSERPRLDFPPIRVYWLGKTTYSEGIETHAVGTTQTKVYSIEKTIADCFKFRAKIGLDVAVSALREGHREDRIDFDKLINYSRIDRVTNVIEPYLKNLL